MRRAGTLRLASLVSALAFIATLQNVSQTNDRLGPLQPVSRTYSSSFGCQRRFRGTCSTPARVHFSLAVQTPALVVPVPVARGSPSTFPNPTLQAADAYVTLCPLC